MHISKHKENPCLTWVKIKIYFCYSSSYNHCDIFNDNYNLYTSPALITTTSVVKLLVCSPQVWYFYGSSSGRFKPKTKIGICFFSAKHAALRRKRKDWLARNQDNMSKWGNMSTHGLLFQWASTINIQLSVLIY
jgi:hypothetical protein